MKAIPKHDNLAYTNGNWYDRNYLLVKEYEIVEIERPKNYWDYLTPNHMISFTIKVGDDIIKCNPADFEIIDS